MITFKQFISEKAMNSSEFNRTAAKHADTAKVGFEFECFIPEQSDLFGSTEINRDWMEVSRLSSIDDVSEYFDVDRSMYARLEAEYDDWVHASPDDEDQVDQRNGDWEGYVDDIYGSVYGLISSNGIDPTYGWEADTGRSSARFYTQSVEDSEANAALEKETFEKIEVSLSHHLSANVTTKVHSSEQHYEKGDWVIVTDGSISSEDHGVGAEIISPPQKLSKALEDLKSVFQWMSENDVQTNKSTGFHINVSVPNIQNIDALKLVLFMGDQFSLKLFGREANEYTESQFKQILSKVKDSGEAPKEASEMIRIAKDWLSNSKYFSVNLSKLKKGYLEFRIAGGAKYHTKFKEIRETLLRFVLALELACDPDAERNEYIKKLSKLFSKAIGSGDSPDAEKYSIQEILSKANEQQVAKSLQTRLENAKSGKKDDDNEFWFHKVLLKSLFTSFAFLKLSKASLKQKAELKMIVKRLNVKSKSDGVQFSWEKELSKMFDF